MTREQLEHAIRAACNVSGDTELIIFGSQAVLGEHPDAPHELRTSIEVLLGEGHGRPFTQARTSISSASVRSSSDPAYSMIGTNELTQFSVSRRILG